MTSVKIMLRLSQRMGLQRLQYVLRRATALPALVQRTSESRRSYSSKDGSLPFLDSRARKFRVKDSYSTDSPRDLRQQRYAIPLGLACFACVLYFSFIKDYGAQGEAVVEFLTEDIAEKIPPGARQRLIEENLLEDRESKPPAN